MTHLPAASCIIRTFSIEAMETMVGIVGSNDRSAWLMLSERLNQKMRSLLPCAQIASWTCRISAFVGGEEYV